MSQPPVDLDLREQQVQDLSNRDAVAGFFAALGYDTAARTRQTPANLGIAAEGLASQIRHAELLADQEGLLQVYLFELNSVTVAATQGLGRAFRNRAGNFLLVLTTRDYDHLDFVLLERYVPEGASPTAMVGRREAAVRPRVLSVERLKPGRVDMRVLRRFTYTEGDPLSQYEKLLSAYTVADWSEENFNNRALFADYYLMERLPLEPEWQEKSRDPYLAVRDLFRDARTRWAGKPEAELRKGLLEPALRSLGFGLESVKAAGSDAPRPDYLLKSPEGGDLGVCLAYPWGRFLDGKDYQRDGESPDENPGALVLSLLQSDGAKWAVVTNGKHWRLYSARTHSRATNYYEIDLEETLAAQDPAELFRYFWVLFRAKAFGPRTVVKDGREETSTFLDQLLDGSEEYAKRLGDRLKGRVFDDIFPHLAQGFVAYRKAQDGAEADLSQEALDGIFQGTLTLLYRLLFLLYAEARDLLPVRETRSYNQVSLTRLKSEVAQAAGDDPSKLDERTKRAYGADSTELYDRLLALFRAVDKGDAALNVPVYNGGLFISQPDPKDESPETRSARFLLANKVPDRHLAAALDLLARDEDEKTFKRVPIDYKSLGVRQLGSIYEGLLEFHLRLAPEKMAVCKGKKTEEIIPYQQAVKDKRTILKQGRGKDAPERTLPKGAVYLENTRHERKATGSYYTPDYIVKYIVEHTVGPVLEEKFRAAEPKLREAQKAHRAAVKRREGFRKQGQEGDDPEKVARDYRDLVDELFDVKVLDPAMGSGHFLVETVDFIAYRMIVFLNGFRWNPVTAPLGTLGETRRTVLREMEEQGVTIDPQSRTLMDNSLLKRHVLKRCIYGVDLNPMAVELAKVSLWLDCFTLGAPLSFLDHHLKYGNSLIGARVEEVQEALQQAPSGKDGHVQFDLLGSQFAGLMLATESMRKVGELSDVTAAQVSRSRTEYQGALDALAPFKRILDIYISQWFGNQREPALELLRSDAGETVARDPKLLSRMRGAQKEIATRALAEAASRRFFHWELEFPEVWYAQGSRKENAGFDAVVGNPPWGGHLEDEDTLYARRAFSGSARGVVDTFALFLELGLYRLRRDGRCGMLLPDIFLLKNYPGIRRLLLDDSRLDELTHWGMPFEEVALDVCSVAFTRATAPTDHRVACYPDPPPATAANLILQSAFRRQTDCRFNLHLTDELSKLLEDARSLGPRFAELFTIREGIHSGNVREKLFVTARETPKAERLIFGRDEIAPYRLRWSGRWVVYDEAIIDRCAGEYANLGDEALHRARKILVRRTGDRVIAALDDAGFFASNNLFLCVPYQHIDELLLLYCLAVLNSGFATWYFRSIQPRTGRLFAELKITHLSEIPMPFCGNGIPGWAGPAIAELTGLIVRPYDSDEQLLHWSEAFAESLLAAIRRASPPLADAVAMEGVRS